MPYPFGTGDAYPPNDPIQEARADAILTAAYDAAPTEMRCTGFKYVTLYVWYTRGVANGAVSLRLEVSPFSAGRVTEAALTDVWVQSGLYESSAVVGGTDAHSKLQREDIKYEATAAAREGVPYGPIQLAGGAARLRVPCAETGVPGTPGTCHVVAVFST